ncbi:MAG: hypothetical protein AUI47_09405 [Acidobacteria bacterium 13_1_40CM_2_68_5]|nr:MAG: hypothetical protein AUI47_09405 [Acidobacteria bacterium 13_1_40CM_2_68_5]
MNRPQALKRRAASMTSPGRAGTKTTVSPMVRARKTLIAWPNMCDSGRVERKRKRPAARTRLSRRR